MRLLRVIVIFLFILPTVFPRAQDIRMDADTAKPALAGSGLKTSLPVIIGDIFLSGNTKTKALLYCVKCPSEKEIA